MRLRHWSIETIFLCFVSSSLDLAFIMKQSNENNLELVPVEATNNISVVGDSMYS